MFLTESEVRAIGLPPHIEALASDSFKPLAHGEVLDKVEEALKAAGLEIARDDEGNIRKRFTTVDDHAKMYATLPLTSRIDDQSRLMIGIANSWNKTLALRIGFGSEVFVCTNGAFFAEKVIGRKHTKRIEHDLPQLISSVLGQTQTFIDQQVKFFARLREVTLTDVEANDLTVRASLDYHCFTAGEIADVVEEWRSPRYEEFAARTLWSWHNAVTEISKRIQSFNGNLHSARMVALSGMLSQRYASDLNLHNEVAQAA